MASKTRQERLEEVARESLDWCLMAYMGNCGERQALQAIRARLIPLFHGPETPTERTDNG